MLNSPNPKHKDTFGHELILSLYDCDLKMLSSDQALKKFVIELCDNVIHMKRYGEPLIPHFGHHTPTTSGYSLVQLIETSSVTGHFSEYKRSAYLNIFSCAWFDAEKTTAYCKKYFKAKEVESHYIVRE